MSSSIDRAQVVKWARELERARARRRALMKALRLVDAEIRRAQKFLRDLTADTREVDE